VYVSGVEVAGLSIGHIYLSHSHPIAIYACPIPWDVSRGIPIGMTFPWTSLRSRSTTPERSLLRLQLAVVDSLTC